MTPIDFSYLSQRSRNYQKTTVTVANGAVFSVLEIPEAEKRRARNIIYLHVHRESRKCYIGVTVMEAGHRWALGAGYRNNRRFGNSIKKHGWGAFDSFVLAFGKNRISLHEAEVGAISAAGGHKSEFTYNLSPGGDVVAENDKPIVGFCFKTRKIHHFKSGADAARMLGMKNADMPMAVARGERSSVAGWWFRFKDDLIAKPPASWGEALRIEAVRLRQGKKVIAVNYATGVEKLFTTTAAAAKATGVEQSQVSAIATGAGLSARGFWFKFEGDTRKIPKIHGQKVSRLTRDRKVYAQNLKTGVQRTFRNCTVADTNLEIYKGAAASVASGKRVSAAGWCFSYDKTTSPPKDFKGALVAKARSKPVIATNIKTGLEQEFDSAKSAAEALEMSRASISHVISGKKKAAKGYKFRLSK